MPWPFGSKRMVRRTCLDCGETWTLEASLAHLRPGRAHGRTPYRVGGYGQLYAVARVAEAEAGFDQELETIRQARTCPKCGSERYKDRRR